MSWKSPLIWPGGKFHMRRQLSVHLPQVASLVSPFFGGGHLELHLAAQRGVRVFGGDVFRPLVCFWRMLLDRPQAMADRIAEECGEFPMDAERAHRAQALWHRLPSDPDPDTLGVALLLSVKLSYGGLLGGRKTMHHGFKDRFKDYGVNRHLHRRVAEFRAPNVSVEHADYRDLLARHSDRFAYCDPPYRIASNLYGSKGEVHREFDHDEFAAVMRARKGPWAVSYNDCPEVRAAFDGCVFHEVHGRYSIGKKDGGMHYKQELLICQP